jgi:hypothetical protein
MTMVAALNYALTAPPAKWKFTPVKKILLAKALYPEYNYLKFYSVIIIT